MNKVKETNFYKWSVDKGDYKRDEESTISFMRRKIFRRRLKLAVYIFIYFALVILISYFIFAEI